MSAEKTDSTSGYKRFLRFANGPAIVRAHQKDSYFESSMKNDLQEVVKLFKGQRFINTYPEEIRVLASTLYLALTTLPGTKTLGEEYTDLIYVNRTGRKLPRVLSRLGFVLSYALVPYLLRALVKRLQLNKNEEEEEEEREELAEKKKKEQRKNSRRSKHKHESPLSKLKEIWGKLLIHLSKVSYVNMLDLINLHLAFFYFSGSYYQLSKRIFGLRYVFGHEVKSSNQPRGNYELLGGLIFMQILFKNYNHLLKFASDRSSGGAADPAGVNGKEAREDIHSDRVYGIPVESEGVDDDTKKHKKMRSKGGLSKVPELIVNGKIDLSDPAQLPYIPENSRKCMLCLSYMTDPACSSCGHVFCWNCIVDWCRERPECPLCRQTVLEQNLLPLR